MFLRAKLNLSLIVLLTLLLTGCATSLPWPTAHSVAVPTGEQAGMIKPESLNRAQVIQQIVGHYAHYDVVAYEDKTPKRPMRTFIISYGFTDFYQQDGQLIQQDRFCHAEQKINFKSVTSTFSDAATQAIVPLPQAVELQQLNATWQLYRPATPTLLGVKGDPALPLNRDAQSPNIIDADNDGHPGVTVDLLIGGFLKGQIYMTRREIFENFVTLHSDGRLVGHVKDASEQFVLGASMKMLAKPSDPAQLPNPEMNPLILVKIDPALNDCEELMARRDEWFPAEPAFY